MNPKRSPLSPEEQEKAKILYASGKTIHAVAQSLGRSAHTLKKFLCKPEIVKEVGIQREELATMFDAITHRTLSGVTDEDIRKSSLLQKMTAAGISIDKALLLRGQATSNIDVRILLDIARQLRDEERAEDGIRQHTEQMQPALLPSPQTEHPTANPEPQNALFPNTAKSPTPTVKVKYYAPNPVEKDSSQDDPLM